MRFPMVPPAQGHATPADRQGERPLPHSSAPGMVPVLPMSASSARLVTVMLLLGALLAPATPGAGAEGCTPGENGCGPTPAQGATGEDNGLWPGNEPDRVAICLGGAGHVVQYVGGDAGTPCGSVILADQVILGDWQDPN